MLERKQKRQMEDRLQAALRTADDLWLDSIRNVRAQRAADAFQQLLCSGMLVAVKHDCQLRSITI